MAIESTRDRELNRQGNLVFALIVAISYLLLLVTPPRAYSPLDTAILLGLGVAYLALGTVGIHRFEQAHSLPVFLAYYAIALAVATAIILFSGSRGQLWLLPLPLVSQATLTLRRPWLVIFCLAVLASMLAPIALGQAATAVLQAGIAMSAGVFFVVLFTQIAANERNSRSQVERLAADLEAANARLREYAVQAEYLATMHERNRLGRDIHDGLGHYLTVINVQLQVARTMLTADPQRAADALDKAQSLANQALADVRRSVAALRATPAASRPLPDAIRELVEENRAAGIVTEMVVTGSPRQLSPQAELTLYRAAQEALTNVRKHAHASRVDLALDYSRAEAVRLTVADNGVGADSTSDGFGLLGLRERVQLLGGTLGVQTTPRGGFVLTVESPG